VLAILKEIMVKFIATARKGKEVKLDFRIGFVHAYPNGELAFENAGEGNSEPDANKYQVRMLKEAKDPI